MESEKYEKHNQGNENTNWKNSETSHIFYDYNVDSYIPIRYERICNIFIGGKEWKIKKSYMENIY